MRGLSAYIGMQILPLQNAGREWAPVVAHCCRDCCFSAMHCARKAALCPAAARPTAAARANHSSRPAMAPAPASSSASPCKQSPISSLPDAARVMRTCMQSWLQNHRYSHGFACSACSKGAGCTSASSSSAPAAACCSAAFASAWNTTAAAEDALLDAPASALHAGKSFHGYGSSDFAVHVWPPVLNAHSCCFAAVSL